MSWQHQRSMTPGQYLWAIRTLNLSRPAAGRFLGVTNRTSYRYADGEAVIPAAHALLLRAMIAHNETPVVPSWHKDQN